MEEHTTQEKTSKPAKETKTVKTTASAAPAEETRTQRPSARTGRTMSRPLLGDMEQRAFISLLHVELIVIIHHQLIR